MERIHIEGPFWKASGTVIRVSSIVKDSILLSEHFERYTDGFYLDNWTETKENFSLNPESKGNFKVIRTATNAVYGIKNKKANLHTHFTDNSARNWSNYQYSGKMQVDNASIDIGVTFLSQYFPNNGKDSYYRLSNNTTSRQLALFKRVNGQERELRASSVKMPSKQFMNFSIAVEKENGLPRIKIKLWPDQSPEPSTFQIDLVDNDATLSAGTVGLWANGEQAKYFDALTVKGSGEVGNLAAYQVFSDHPTLNPGSNAGLSGATGTMVAICDIENVEIALFGSSADRLQWQRPPDPAIASKFNAGGLSSLVNTGRLSLLALRINESKEAGRIQAHCTNGQINLDLLNPVDNARTKLYELLQIAQVSDTAPDVNKSLPGKLYVHSSGLGVYGSKKLPWMNANQDFVAPFQLYQLFPSLEKPAYQLHLHEERLTTTEASSWIKAWQKLSVYVNPAFPQHPLSLLPAEGIGKTPTWVTLELTNIFSVPKLFWSYEVGPANEFRAINLSFKKGALQLYLSDQKIYDLQNPPTSIAQIAPDVASIPLGGKLRLQLTAGDSTALEQEQQSITYQANKTTTGVWEEDYQCQALQLGYHALDTPRFLRKKQNIVVPEWVVTDPAQQNPISEPILWGLMPLENGWAQLPVLNLTEQIYLDAGLDVIPQSINKEESRPFSGVMTIRNKPSKTTANEEHDWDLSITNVTYLQCNFDLEQQAESYTLKEIQIEFIDPDIALNGLFWLSTGKPRIEDALPDLEDWINGLSTIPLRSISAQRTLFPLPLFFTLPALKIRAEHPSLSPTRAVLDSWSISYRSNLNLLETMIQKKVLPAGISFQPMLWLRHPFLPTVQALPITQSKTPPNFPSASRQLAPFYFEPAAADQKIYAAQSWVFGQNGALGWLLPEGVLKPATAWQNASDLPMVALSLPGLVFDPLDGIDLPEGLTSWQQLKMQFRSDLAYLDEVFALAQLPKKAPNPNEVSPLANTPPPEPIQALIPETYAEHWGNLSNLAALASADKVDLLSSSDANTTTVTNLIEPLSWEIELQADLTNYPGSLLFKDVAGNGDIMLHRGSALQGISGKFTPSGPNQVVLSNPDSPENDTPFEITAHSMSAWKDPANGMYRDQRGLYRNATKATDLQTQHPLLQTALLNAENQQNIQLSTSIQAIEMAIEDGASWMLWFKDLPLMVDNQVQIFKRSSTRSVSGQDKDANDPEALSKNYNHLQGYEWRLKDIDAAKSEQTFLDILNLHFYPLSLLECHYEDGQMKAVQIRGSLQLPLPGGQAFDNLNNAVDLHFVLNAGESKLRLESIKVVDGFVEWPMDFYEHNIGEVPRLCWNKITIEGGAANRTFVLQQPRLKFVLFQVDWTIPLNNLDLSIATHTLSLSAPNPIRHIWLKTVQINLGLITGEHKLNLIYQVQIGATEKTILQADVRCNLLDSPERSLFEWVEGELFGLIPIPLEVSQPENELSYTDLAFQFKWASLTQLEDYYFLPGIALKPTQQRHNPGFAAITFNLSKNESGIPDFNLKFAFVEALFSSSWGSFLQDNLQLNIDASAVFDATAGEMTIGYTTEFVHKQAARQWLDTVVLNGFLEIKNLLSWPLGLQMDQNNSNLIVPGINGEKAFEHTRHSIRVLLNQHQIPSSILKLNDLQTRKDKMVLFRIDADKTWQFLAITEHQLTPIDAQKALNGSLTLSDLSQCRWTALQEIRFLPIERFQKFIRLVSGQVEKIPAENPSKDPISRETVGQFLEIKGRIVNTEGIGVPNLQVELYLEQEGAIDAFPGNVQPSNTHEDGSFSFEKILSKFIFPSAGGPHQLRFKISRGGSTLVTPEVSPAWTTEIGKAVLRISMDVPPKAIAYLGQNIAKQLDEALGSIKDEILLVEASAPFWIRSKPLSTQLGSSYLQFLPNGLQTCLPSSASDFGVSDPQTPEWQFSRLPFLGRMLVQPEQFSKIETVNSASSPIVVDPVLVLLAHQKQNFGAAPFLALALSSWSENKSYQRSVSPGDLPYINRWPQLDLLSIEENLARQQAPLRSENELKGLISITASYPNNIGCLSRGQALSRAFEATRKSYPSRIDLNASIAPSERLGAIVWREDSLIEFDTISAEDQTSHLQIAWLIAGLHAKALLPEPTSEGTHRKVAVTALPSPGNAHAPLTFAVSPYLGMGFHPAGGSPQLKLVSSELLVFEKGQGALQPITSKLWEIDGLKVSEDNYQSLAESWAKEIQTRLAPESSLIILRYRNLEENSSDPQPQNAQVVVKYSFGYATPYPKELLAQRVFNLRARVDQLFFQEGQFNSAAIPSELIPARKGGPNPTNRRYYFEVAPPQITGVQPIYVDASSTEESLRELAKQLPWGLSTLQLSTTFTAGKAAVVGSETALEKNSALVIWWQAMQRFVQYRSAQDNGPRGGLPGKFRARAILSLLPILPKLPMPKNELDAFLIPLNPSASGISRHWQAVLPGAIKTMAIGSRPGVAMVQRHFLITQLVEKDAEGMLSTSSLNSGSIPVQHRFPRPVGLPDNIQGKQLKALQTWASYFKSTQHLHAQANPIDEAYFAALQFSSDLLSADQGLRMRLEKPSKGAFDPEWNGQLIFEATTLVFQKNAVNQPQAATWIINIEAQIDRKLYRWEVEGKDGSRVIYRLKDNLENFQNHLKSLAPGSTVDLIARVNPGTDTSGYTQALRFTLRNKGNLTLKQPLQPYFIHFEDPEYNRALASSSGNVTRNIKIGKTIYALRLSSDRKIYNPDSELFFRFDWDQKVPTHSASLILKYKHAKSGNEPKIFEQSGLEAEKLYSIKLLDHQPTGIVVSTGDTLILELTVNFNGFTQIIVLNTALSTEPLTPTPEAAYALLREQIIQGHSIVDCPRFAWSALPQRIELVNPDDLKEEVVRRRAVFQWVDAVRMERQVAYELQKIALNGSTHFPEFKPGE